MAVNQGTLALLDVLRDSVGQLAEARESDRGRAMQVLQMKVSQDEAEKDRLFNILRDEMNYAQQLERDRFEYENKVSSFGISMDRIERESNESGLRTDALAALSTTRNMALDKATDIKSRIESTKSKIRDTKHAIYRINQKASEYGRGLSLAGRAYDYVRNIIPEPTITGQTEVTGDELSKLYKNWDKLEFSKDDRGEAIKLTREMRLGLEAGIQAMVDPAFKRRMDEQQLALRRLQFDFKRRQAFGEDANKLKEAAIDKYRQIRSYLMNTEGLEADFGDNKRFFLPEVPRTAEDVQAAVDAVTMVATEYMDEEGVSGLTKDQTTALVGYKDAKSRGDLDMMRAYSFELIEGLKDNKSVKLKTLWATESDETAVFKWLLDAQDALGSAHDILIGDPTGMESYVEELRAMRQKKEESGEIIPASPEGWFSRAFGIIDDTLRYGSDRSASMAKGGPWPVQMRALNFLAKKSPDVYGAARDIDVYEAARDIPVYGDYIENVKGIHDAIRKLSKESESKKR